MLLAGDIGGTKTHLAIFSPDKGPRQAVVEKVYPSAGYPNLESIAQEFMAEVKLPIERAVFGVAGPVVDAQATITNLPWIIRESRLREVLGVDCVALLNDLQAIAYSVPYLQDEDVHTLNDGDVGPPRLDCGHRPRHRPGRGLLDLERQPLPGACLRRRPYRLRPHQCAGDGPVSLHAAALRPRQLRKGLLRAGHSQSVLVPQGHRLRARAALAGAEAGRGQELTPVIVNAALAHETQPCELAVATLRLFVSILGAEAGNLGLKLMSTGGVYLGGGIRSISCLGWDIKPSSRVSSTRDASLAC